MKANKKNQKATATDNSDKKLSNALWGMYTRDVLLRGLRNEITFLEYCKRITQ